VFPEGVERILGVGMWGKDSTGVVVHNVPMRGSSGTLFRKLDREVLREQAAGLAVGCVLLQYGGNAVPYLKDSLAAERYGRWFGSNLRLIQEMFPEAAVVVMGNADMAENVNGSWVTRPLVENVRDALKASALAEHALFFDVYEAMGGRNSMGAWVAAEPALAAADHVHFTRRGSRLLAERLWALLFEQEAS
jgi:lysophospholipase L1-like esterase